MNPINPVRDYPGQHTGVSPMISTKIKDLIANDSEKTEQVEVFIEHIKEYYSDDPEMSSYASIIDLLQKQITSVHIDPVTGDFIENLVESILLREHRDIIGTIDLLIDISAKSKMKLPTGLKNYYKALSKPDDELQTLLYLYGIEGTAKIYDAVRFIAHKWN